MSAREDGFATVVTVMLIGGLVFVTGLAAAVVGLIDTHRQAESAADLAALAGAGALTFSHDPCTAARDVARRNRARVTTCAVSGATVVVAVRVSTRVPLVPELTARARAGPA